MKRFSPILPALVLGFSSLPSSWINAQTTVTYTQQTGNYPNSFTVGTAGSFNQGSTEVGMFANGGGTKQVVLWREFTTDGTPSGAARDLQVGDELDITVAATRAFGRIGFSLNDNAATSSWADRISNSLLNVNLDGPAYAFGSWGDWYVNHGSGATSFGFGGDQFSYRDHAITLKKLSSNSFTITLGNGVSGPVTYRDLAFLTSGTASGFSIFLEDDWDGDNNSNIFWKPTTELTNTGTVEIGYGLGGSSTLTVDGVISDGLAANSTSTTSVNNLFIGGASGTRVDMTSSNTFSGSATVNPNATLRINNASALGTTAGSTTISSGATLELTGGFTLAETLTLNGLGVGGIGALRNIANDHLLTGNFSNVSNSRVDVTSGTQLTLSGILSGSATLEFTGTGTSILSGVSANILTGDITVSSGTLVLNKTADTKAADDVVVNNGATLRTDDANQWGTGTPPLVTVNGTFNANGNDQRAALAGTDASATVTLGTAALTIENTGTDNFAGSVTGSGGSSIIKEGSGTMAFGGAVNVSTISVDAGTLSASADNVIADNTDITVDGGTLDLQNETIDALNLNGGTVNLSSGETLTVGAMNDAGGSIAAAANSTLVLNTNITPHVLQTQTLEDLVIEAGADLTLTSGTLTVNGTLELRGGSISLSGGALAFGASAEVYYNTGGTVSPSNEWTASLTPATIRVGSGTTVELDEALQTTNITIESGGTLDLNGFDLTVASGGTLTNDGTFTAGTRKVVFAGTGTVAGGQTTAFHDVDLNDGVDFGANSSVAGELRILAGGFVNTNRPEYLAGSTLVYATGASYNITAGSREWELGAATNNPDNVEVRTSSVVVDASGGAGLTCTDFLLTGSGSITFNPPTTGDPTSFNLLQVNGNLSTAGTGTFLVNNGEGDDTKPAANGAFDVRVAGDITIGSGTTVQLNADRGDDLYVRGDFTIDGTFNPNNRAVYFDGSALQTLTDNGGTTFDFVRVQNSAATTGTAVRVVTDWTVDDLLDLQEGVLETTTGNTLTLTANASITENSSQSWLNGVTVQTKVINAAPVDISYGLSIDPGSNNLGSTTVTVTSGTDGVQNNPVFLSQTGIAKVWDLEPTTQPSSTVTLDFTWNTAHDNGKDIADLYGWRRPDGAVAWREVVGPLDLTSTGGADNTIGTMTTDSFSSFTFSDGGNPLPVELVVFEGQPVQGGVQLDWATAAELNNDYFTVERSPDGQAWTALARVEGAGSTTRRTEYGHFDAQPRPGLNYYRLRQTDFDRTEALSEVIGVRVEAAGQAAVFPVPATERVWVEWTFARQGGASLRLIDALGRPVAAMTAETHAGLNRLSLPVAALPAGMYRLELRDAAGALLHTAPVPVR